MIRSVSSLGLLRIVSVSSSVEVTARNVSSLLFCSEYNDYIKKIQNKGRFSCKDLSKNQSVPIGPPPGQLPWVSENTKSKTVSYESSNKPSADEMERLKQALNFAGLILGQLHREAQKKKIDEIRKDIFN